MAVEAGGKPFTVSTGLVGCGGMSADRFTQVAEELLLTYEPSEGEAPWSRGQIVIAGDVAAFSNADALYLEVNVVGVLGGIGDIIARCALGQGHPNARVDVDKPFEKIVFEVRRGYLPTDSPLQSKGLGFTASGRFWR